MSVVEASALWLAVALVFCLAAGGYSWITFGKKPAMRRYRVALVVPLAIWIVSTIRSIFLLLA